MGISTLKLGWGLAAFVLALISCQTSHKIAPWEPPTTTEATLSRAQVELDHERLWKAWVLLMNFGRGSDLELSLLKATEQRLLERFASWRAQPGSHPVAQWSANLVVAGLSSATSADLSSPAVLVARPQGPAGTPSDWLKGTVTVIVNKGLKLDHGSASPDVVIGSGFFIDESGLLITNEHVIASAIEPGTVSSRISLRLPGSKGERVPAKVIGWDKNHDVALLKAEVKPDYVFAFSPIETVTPGQRLQALGSPGGLEATVTEGIVSATGRTFLPMGEVFQIDVAVNPGNSGGPLVDSSGQVVGVVFAGVSEFQGVNFAIPAPLVQRLLPQLKAGGKAFVPWMGLGLQEDMTGLEVVYVLPQSPADFAGFLPGDRLVSFDKVPVKEIAHTQALVLNEGADRVAPMGIIRAGQSRTLWTTFEARPDFPLQVATESDLVGKLLPLVAGIEADDVGTPVDRSFRVKRVWAGTDGEALQLTENDPVTVLEWQADTKRNVLTARLAIKRRVGGYFEAQVQLEAPLAFRQFL
ncbi:MAG: trypsin-like peptidase domain-containing protein [Spirochaetales bacterium]